MLCASSMKCWAQKLVVKYLHWLFPSVRNLFTRLYSDIPNKWYPIALGIFFLVRLWQNVFNYILKVLSVCRTLTVEESAPCEYCKYVTFHLKSYSKSRSRYTYLYQGMFNRRLRVQVELLPGRSRGEDCTVLSVAEGHRWVKHRRRQCFEVREANVKPVSTLSKT